MALLDNKTVVITGGTGSLGKALTRRLLSGASGRPKKVIVFSRDEAKQHSMRVEAQKLGRVTDEVMYHNFERLLEFRIGDVRDYHAVCSVLRSADVVVNAAALKQVPACEYFPYEAVQTNVLGAENLVRAIRDNDLQVDTLVGVSTDKACQPISVMGMTKALQERVLITANITAPQTRFICVRYGNVLASRGSVVPLFQDQIRGGGPVTITSEQMTRFFLPLEQAVDTILAAIEGADPGETYVPKVPSARIVDIATALMGKRDLRMVVTGIRPGEKVHEILVSAEEGWRTFHRGGYLVIKPMLPELASAKDVEQTLGGEYSSSGSLMTLEQTRELLQRHNLMVGQEIREEGQLL
jgi:UDP-glucose 4-epimerase